MELTSLTLFGRPFAQCFALSNANRIAHEMRGEACLTFIRRGEQEFYSPVSRWKVGGNESILMKCGNFILGHANKAPTNGTLGMVFHLNPESIKLAFGDKRLDFLKIQSKNEPTDSAIKLGQDDLIEGFADSLNPYFQNEKLVNQELMAVKLQELVTILMSQGNADVMHLLATILEKEVFEFDEIVNSNLYNNLSIAELAHLAGKSESSFKREFKRIYNSSPAKYIKSKKLEKAVELLATSEMSVSEISLECGFEDLAHFSSSFSKVHSESPRSYRASIAHKQ